MSKMSELGADRQQIERLTDVVRPPSFAVSGRAGLHFVPPPPPPTTFMNPGFPHPIICTIGLIGWLGLIAVITWVYFGAPRP